MSEASNERAKRGMSKQSEVRAKQGASKASVSLHKKDDPYIFLDVQSLNRRFK